MEGNLDVKLKILLEHMDIKCRFYRDDRGDYHRCVRARQEQSADGFFEHKYVACGGQVSECDLTEEDL